MSPDQIEMALQEVKEDRQKLGAVQDHVENILQPDLSYALATISDLQGQVDSLIEIVNKLKSGTVVTTDENLAFAETKESKCKRLYTEIEKRGYLKTKDVANFLGCKHYMQAHRIMQAVEQLYQNVEMHKTTAKGVTVIRIQN